jgi:PAS domain S-box-containing protein
MFFNRHRNANKDGQPEDNATPGETTALDVHGAPLDVLPNAGNEVQLTVQETPTRYRISRVLGEGGMGTVTEAHDEHLDREVAIKALRPEKRRNVRTAARFQREARLTGQLQHPGIVPVYELTSPESPEPFYTMRLVRGRTLTEIIAAYHEKRLKGQAEPLEFVGLLNNFVAVCNTIAYAHSRGILHRDLKGDNIVVGDFGEAIVLDWGLAKRIGRTDETSATDASAEVIDAMADPGLTQSGEVMGTPAYMAPEQAMGLLDQIDQRTDIYGLGAMLYEILTGRPPHVGQTTLEVLKLAQRSEILLPSELVPDVPPALEAVCMKALAREAAERYGTASELALEVNRWQDDQRRKAEEALRRQTEILRSILDSMADGVLVADSSGQIHLMNPTAERMLGRALEPTLSSLGLESRVYQSDGVTPFEKHQVPMVRAIRGEELDDVDVFLRAGNESGIWASLTARPLRDESGSVQASVMVLRDVTERRRVEQELFRSRERFELAVAGSQDGLWDWDLATNETYFSPRWKSILGYEDHEIANHIDEWAVRLHPEERERVIAANLAHIEGNTPHYEYEYRLRHKDGSYRWILARGVALRDKTGKAYRMAGSHVDVTERKRLEQALRERDAGVGS